MPPPTSPSAPVADAPLTDAYRIIRTVSPPETPLEGTLARDGDQVVLLVDAAALESWAGWAFDRAQHVLGPHDIARRPDGHVAVMPWCTERVDVFLGRRRAAASPLSGGEVVTLVVSALRGTAEAHQGRAGDEASPRGTWWLTDAGRPVFVHGESGADVEAGARRIVEDAVSSCDDRVLSRLVSAAMSALDRPRTLAQEASRLESELFHASAPQPLATTIFPAARVRDLEAPALRPVGGTAVTADFSRPLRDTIARHVDGELADAVAVTVGGVVRAVRAKFGRGRRAPWLAAAGVAGAIVLAGALWPTDGGHDPVAQAAEPGSSSASPHPFPTDASTPAAPLPVDTPATPEAEAPEAETPALPLEAEAGLLLDRWASCGSADETSCRDDVLEQTGLQVSPGVIDLPARERVITLLDDYGGAAVLRVESAAGNAAPQLMVIIRTDDGWLLRDVYDVAEQPSK
ncbi:hypothetical protein ACLQ2Q_04755 [Microbacterium sp. DT81.1]|uniref:hypothetical protein n=1 Tax=Microbacterium sp. DT81.1 TaxID=3393413 RepID=UPI003CFB1BD5